MATIGSFCIAGMVIRVVTGEVALAYKENPLLTSNFDDWAFPKNQGAMSHQRTRCHQDLFTCANFTASHLTKRVTQNENSFTRDRSPARENG